MSETQKPSHKGSDWTRLLTDPDLVNHLGELLQIYREAAPEKREAALLKAMREIKEAAAQARLARGKNSATAEPLLITPNKPLEFPQPVEEAPPFDPDLFTPPMESDRRRHPRIKCYVVVEINVEGVKDPMWGNLANVGLGGCLIETVNAVPQGKTLKIGLWVANGKIWVKGVVVSGIAVPGAPSFGVRVKFSEAELSEKEHLREFLKCIASTTRKAHNGSAYVAQLKN
jgi:hypothetical protein